MQALADTPVLLAIRSSANIAAESKERLLACIKRIAIDDFRYTDFVCVCGIVRLLLAKRQLRARVLSLFITKSILSVLRTVERNRTTG